MAYKLKLMNLKQYQGQSAQPGLSVNTLSNIKVNLPKLIIQKKVFNILNLLDSKIELNNKINAELESMAKNYL
ncbi:restriction endonuclease subunit S [Megamonas hypermegale]|uniref:restriction endonuclease subunit S n=1 Tax=Megamonas hypermegale TaxID=158847 RepID=UPI0037CC5598